MTTYVRPPYLEELPPTRRLPDFIPALPAPVRLQDPTAGTAADEPARPLPPPPAAVAPAIAADSTATQPTVRRSGCITSPVHRIQRPTGLALSFTLTERAGAGPPTTHRVYSTRQFAERLAKLGLAEGSLVELAGQPQLREERQPDGSTCQVPYFYCFGARVLPAVADPAAARPAR